MKRKVFYSRLLLAWIISILIALLIGAYRIGLFGDKATPKVYYEPEKTEQQ